MAKDENAKFWLAPGVVQVDGKDYGIDKPLPVDKIDKKLLAKWIKAGKVGEKIKAVVNDEVTQLKELVATQAEKIVELEGGDCEACAESAEKITELEEKVVELEAQVEALTEPKE